MYTANNPWVRLLTLLILGAVLAACTGNMARHTNHVRDMPAANAPQNQASQNEGNRTTTVNVTVRDFEFLLDTTGVEAGSITFRVTNNGSMPHDFAIMAAGEEHRTSLLQPGASESLSVDFQPGAYNYICTVPGHAILGMQGVFTVT